MPASTIIPLQDGIALEFRFTDGVPGGTVNIVNHGGGDSHVLPHHPSPYYRPQELPGAIQTALFAAGIVPRPHG